VLLFQVAQVASGQRRDVPAARVDRLASARLPQLPNDNWNWATNAQVKRLRAEMTKTGSVGTAAVRAGMSPNTATKYLKTDKLPSETSVGRSWWTRPDPFDQDWAWVEEQLVEAPGFEAKTLFDELVRLYPGRYQDGQLRTLQRRIKQWRATKGPDKELFLPQDHVPGEAMQTDFTWMHSLRIAIGGESIQVVAPGRAGSHSVRVVT
jgi:hypothetical protein